MLLSITRARNLSERIPCAFEGRWLGAERRDFSLSLWEEHRGPLGAFLSQWKLHCKLAQDILHVQHNPPLLSHIPPRIHNSPHLPHLPKHAYVACKRQRHCWWEDGKGKKGEALRAVLLHLNEEVACSPRMSLGEQTQAQENKTQHWNALYPYCSSGFYNASVSLRHEINTYVQIQNFHLLSCFLNEKKQDAGEQLPFTDRI